jgi:hypothetical protein
MQGRMTVIVAACLIALTSPGLPSPANAVTLRLMNLGELTLQADLIFSGRVTKSESRWNELRTTIWTYVTFSIQEMIKGDAPGTEITLRLPGGTIVAEDIRLRVGGVPEFTAGEEALIFCSLDPAMKCPIIGWLQGRFTLQDNGAGGKVIAEAERALRIMPAKRATLAAEKTPPAVAYGDFVSEVRRMMNLPGETTQP